MATKGKGTIRNKWVWRWLVGLLAMLVGASVALAQGPRGGGPRGPHGPRHGRIAGPMMPRGEGMRRHRPQFMKRLRDLPPEQQERVLSNDERFRRLPPERQEMIRERLRRWNALSPEERGRMRERQEIFESLSPAQRREARALSQEWQRLDPERRQELRQALRHVRDLPSEERPRFLASPEIEKRFSPQEREVLVGLSQLLPESRNTPSVADESQE